MHTYMRDDCTCSRCGSASSLQVFPEDLVKINCGDALCLCGVLFLARAPVCVRMDTAAVVACQITEGFWLKPLSKKHA